jgi:hypothetical protein
MLIELNVKVLGCYFFGPESVHLRGAVFLVTKRIAYNRAVVAFLFGRRFNNRRRGRIAHVVDFCFNNRFLNNRSRGYKDIIQIRVSIMLWGWRGWSGFGRFIDLRRGMFLGLRYRGVPLREGVGLGKW